MIDFVMGTVKTYQSRHWMESTSIIVATTNLTEYLILCDGSNWATTTLITPLLLQLVDAIGSEKSVVIDNLTLNYNRDTREPRHREGFIMSVSGYNSNTVSAFVPLSQLWNLGCQLETILASRS